MGEAKTSSRQERKRTEILDAATAAFRDHGYDTVSMDRIAELAGASKRTVYNHFGSKEALFGSVVEHLMAAALEQKKIPWDPARGLDEQLRDFARAKISMLRTEHGLDLVRVVLGVFIRDPELATSVMSRTGIADDHLVRWLHKAVEAGALRIDDPPFAAELFWGMVSGTLFWPHVFEHVADEAHEQRLVDEVVAVFLCRFRKD